MDITERCVCDEHKDEIVDKYCRTCSTGICGLCVKLEHLNHNIVSINDEHLIMEKRSELLSYKRYFEWRESEKKAPEIGPVLQENFTDAQNKLEKLRQELNDTIDTLQTGLKQELIKQQDKLTIHKSDLDDIKDTRDKLFACIDDVLQRNSAHDLVQTVNNLPTIPPLPIPTLLHTYTTPSVTDYNPIIRSLQTAVNYRIHTQDKHQVISLSDTPQSPTIGQDKDNPPGEISDTQVTLDTDHPVVSRECEEPVMLWESVLEGLVYDVVYDSEGEDPGWWVRGAYTLYRYNREGVVGSRVGEGVVGQGGCVCINTRRGWVVTTNNNDRVTCLSRTGEVVKEMTVPEDGWLYGVTYCHHRNTYVMADIRHSSILHVNSDSCLVIQTVGVNDSRIKYPWMLCHQNISDVTCHVVVTDFADNSVHVITGDGDVIRTLGCKGRGDRELRQPYGVCADTRGRVVVCDSGNWRVVRYWCDGSNMWEEVLVTRHCCTGSPWCVSLSDDVVHMLVGMNSGRGTLKCFNIHPLA